VRSEFRHLFGLAWPTSLGMLAFMAMNVVDSICVGQLGGSAQAGVAAANAWGLSGAVLAMGAVRAIEPIVSQAFGEGDREAAGQALTRMLVLSLPFAALAGGWYLLAPWGLRLLGQPESVIPYAQAYVVPMALSWPIAMLSQTLRTFLQAIGIVKPAMVVTVAFTVVKVPLNLWLMHGGAGVPALGVAGTSISTCIVDLLVLAVLAWAVRPTLRSWWPRHAGLSPRALGKLLLLGLPLGVQMGTEFWAFATMGVMMGWLGEAPLAAHAAAINLASVSFMLPLGVGTAAAARVGHRFGAGQDWWPSAKAALAMGVGTQLVSGAVFLFAGRWLVEPYSPDPDVRLLAASLMPIAAAFQLFDGVQVIGFGVLRGAGDVRVPTIANLVGYYGFGIPVAYAVGIWGGLGPQGIWWGLSLGLGVVAAGLLLRIRYVHRRGAVRVR
jgi:multidrug resistance protein, MATE family